MRRHQAKLHRVKLHRVKLHRVERHGVKRHGVKRHGVERHGVERQSAAIALLVCSISANAFASVQLIEEPALGGVEQQLQVRDADGNPAPGVEVRGAYYPASEIEEKVLICTTDANGQCAWTPKYSGLVRLRALGRTTVIAVRYPSIPISAVLTFLVAAGALFGGLAVSMYYLLTAKPVSDTDAPA